MKLPWALLLVKASELLLSGRMIQYGSLLDRAASSDTLLADVTAVRKASLSVRNQNGQDSAGIKGCRSSALSTVSKSQAGNRAFLRGLIFMVAFKNCFTSGLSAHLYPVKHDKAEICPSMYYRLSLCLEQIAKSPILVPHSDPPKQNFSVTQKL